MDEKKYAVVTGSTKGIGKAIAKKLLQENFYVIANYAADEETAKKCFEEMSEISNSFTLIHQKLDTWDSVQKFSSAILKTTNSIDCLIINAATTDRTPFNQITPEGWQRVIDVNLSAPFYLVQSLSHHIKPNTGSILFIGSLMGIYPHAMSVGYSVTKAAIHHMSKSLVKIFSPDGITVNVIAPSFVETPWQSKKPADIRERIEAKIALHRFAEPEEIAELCWHVINNRYINGSVLEISGGYCYK